MREFSWTNSDVIEWLQGLKDKLVSLTEVMQFFKDEFNVTKGKRAIYNHMPETTSEEVFIDKDEVLSLHSKYGNKLKAIKEGDKFRVYTMKIRGIYECIDCKHVSQDERPVPLPLLFEKRGRYKLNKGVHHSICFLWTKNELLAREIDRKMREEVQANPLMKPQEAHEKGQQLALQMARSAGETGKEHDSIAIVFQSWHEVRNSYYRRCKQAATSVSDPFKPPGIYNQTYRAFCDAVRRKMAFTGRARNRRDCLRELREFLVLESVAKRGKAFNTMDWTFLSVKTIPTQMNGSDCGVFLCRFAECIARDADTDFKAADMNEFRKKIVQGIKSGKLI